MNYAERLLHIYYFLSNSRKIFTKAQILDHLNSLEKNFGSNSLYLSRDLLLLKRLGCLEVVKLRASNILRYRAMNDRDAHFKLLNIEKIINGCEEKINKGVDINE